MQGFALYPNHSLSDSRTQKTTQRPSSPYIPHCTHPPSTPTHRHDRMPKRIPTPPPPVDESKYLAVMRPYPLHANLELHADRRTLALWLACCAGKDVLLAMFYKPSVSLSRASFSYLTNTQPTHSTKSPEMVVIKVDRESDRFHELLGLHVWSEFSRMEPQQFVSGANVFLTVHSNRILVLLDIHTQRPHTVTALQVRRRSPARRCAAFSRNNVFLRRPLRRHHQVIVVCSISFGFYFKQTGASRLRRMASCQKFQCGPCTLVYNKR